MKRYLYLIFALIFIGCNTGANTSKRIDQTINKAVENVSNIEPVLRLIDQKDSMTAKFFGCIGAQTAVNSTQNLCLTYVQIDADIARQNLLKERLTICQLAKTADWPLQNCLNYFSK